MIERGHADQRGDLAAGEVTEFGQLAQQGERGDPPDPRDAAEEIVLRPVEGTRGDGGGEVAVDVGQAFFQPADVRGDVPLDGPAGEAEAILLGGEHLEQLPPAGEQGVEELGGLVRQGPHRGPDALTKQREGERVDGVGLGEASHGLREVADLAWIDDHDRQAELGESGDRGRLEATGRFQDDQGGVECPQPGQQLSKPRIVVRDRPGLGIGQTGDVEGGLRHIDADEALHTVPQGERSTWPGLADAGWIPGQLFGLLAITTGWRPG